MKMTIQTIKKFPFFRFYELVGVDKIAQFVESNTFKECNTADIMNWIFYYDFPAIKTAKNIWIANKAMVKKFLKEVLA